MITVDSDVQVFIYNKAIDMRKSIDGLSLLVIEGMKLDPQTKGLYLFRNRAADKFKAIFWDGGGFMLMYKRSEMGSFKFPKDIEADYYEIDSDLFNWLRKGFDFYALKSYPELKTSEELINIVISLSKTIGQQQLNLAKLRHFGRKSEKIAYSQQMELGLFDEACEPENVVEITAVDEIITIPEHKRKKSGRKPLPKELPRVRQIHDLAYEDKICSCGCVLTKIGEDKTEQLDIIPAKIQIIEYVNFKYACKACEETIKTALTPKQPIPRSIASPGLLAYVLTSKYKDHLPLYRQENIFQRMGVDIVRNTLARWVIKSAELLEPIYKLLQDNVISYDVAYADETTVQVLKELGRDAQSKSYMWCFIGGPPKLRSIIYHYDSGRAHTIIEDVLDDFKGYLHCDGFTAYDTYANKREVKLYGCWMHARRRFIEVTKVAKSNGVAHSVVALIAKLYAIEKHIKENHYNVDNTFSYRQKNATPILVKIKGLLEDSINEVLPKSALGLAVSYCLNQWHKLIRYIDDGRLDIDNGLTERAIKPFVIGRKNWMFSDSVAGVKAGQIIYSIIETCIAHKVEPYVYLRYVMTKLPSLSSMAEIETLMPYNINKSLLDYN